MGLFVSPSPMGKKKNLPLEFIFSHHVDTRFGLRPGKADKLPPGGVIQVV